MSLDTDTFEARQARAELAHAQATALEDFATRMAVLQGDWLEVWHGAGGESWGVHPSVKLADALEAFTSAAARRREAATMLEGPG